MITQHPTALANQSQKAVGLKDNGILNTCALAKWRQRDKTAAAWDLMSNIWLTLAKPLRVLPFGPVSK